MVIRLSHNRSIDIAAGSKAMDVVKSIDIQPDAVAVAAKINGTLVDLSTEVHENDMVEAVTFDSKEGKSVFWHSSSHILAQAVQKLFPGAKIAIGPSIENGFYYDFEVESPFTPDDLENIERECREIIGKKIPFIRKEYSHGQALEYFQGRGEKYKVELLQDIEGNPSVYRQGEWMDLCRGPHIPDTGYIGAFKLLTVAGAYWRGDEHNTMLQRIYGISFPTQKELTDYITFLEEAAKRDHRKLGKELDLFSFHSEGAGFTFWHPKGMLIYNTIADFSRKEHLKAGYEEVKTPIILNEELWHRSGHWDRYRENMYFTEIDETMHAIKPMNCPGGLLIYKDKAHSYRELPLKYFEFGLVHRHEKAGVLQGLFRVRQFTQDDAHIFCEVEQIELQVAEVMDFIVRLYHTFGFHEFRIELSTRPAVYIGELEIWDISEKALESVLKNKGIEYTVNPGEGAFYGPKIDFHILDSLRRQWQCGTIQLDFSMPKRFDCEYIASDGQRRTPVMIHRALLGSFERFIGILLEHYGGYLPLWLAPVQVKVIPISEKYREYAATITDILKNAGIRAELDARNEKLGYKIRDAETKKIKYMAITGEREAQARQVSVRIHTKGDQGSSPVEQLIQQLHNEIDAKE